MFLPTTSPAVDYYGATRLGDNRYANSVVALRASTGKLVWHFQTVHHDLWITTMPAGGAGHAARWPRCRAPGHPTAQAVRLRSRDRRAAISRRAGARLSDINNPDTQ